MSNLICGLPNAGKTTFSAQYSSCIHYDSLNLITPKRYEHICNAARLEEDICIDGVYDEQWRRAELVNACHEGGHRAVCIWLDTPLEVCLERERNYRRRPDSLVLAHAKSFEPPTLDEGWDEIRIIRGEEVIVQSIDNQNKT